MTRYQRALLQQTLGEMVKATKAPVALAFTTDPYTEQCQLDPDSNISVSETMTGDLYYAAVNFVETYFLNKACPHNPLYFSDVCTSLFHDYKLFGGLENVRYIPLIEGLDPFAVIFLFDGQDPN